MSKNDIITMGQEVVRTEAEGLSNLIPQMDESFASAVETIASIKGRVVLTGVGKSGLIGRKIAATMMSLGTPALFMHPDDGLHGDLGSIMTGDVVIVISNSGNTKEIAALLPSLKNLDVPIIAITAKLDSILANKADITLECRVEKEACSLGLAPTASTTAQLALGDALAVVLSEVKGFDRASFKVFHPAGALGRQLMIRISEVMITGERIPMVEPSATMREALEEMTKKSVGFTLVGSNSKVEGIITDGDLRRLLIKSGESVQGMRAGDIMTPDPKSISGKCLAIDALDMMEEHQITSLCVTNGDDTLKGIVHLHDLLGRGRLSLKNT